MANDADNAHINLDQEVNDAFPNPEPGLMPPDVIAPYDLPAFDSGAIFDPITRIAIQESVQRPGSILDVEELEKFLREKLDRRTQRSAQIFLGYTENVESLKEQLTWMQNRMKWIAKAEKPSDYKLKRRTRKLEEGLRGSNQQQGQYVLNLSSLALEAFRHAGSEGPLDETGLREFIATGRRNPQVDLNQLIRQIKELRLRVNDNMDFQIFKVRLYSNRIRKALKDIEIEGLI